MPKNLAPAKRPHTTVVATARCVSASNRIGWLQSGGVLVSRVGVGPSVCFDCPAACWNPMRTGRSGPVRQGRMGLISNAYLFGQSDAR